ncbi:hypothetical protein DL98DRAFT_598934 [Cadophora sp. DSE1049]|nr:hypothetical protein DL98DRAFT_598934 [Cadophora sp. DSE1049]
MGLVHRGRITPLSSFIPLLYKDREVGLEVDYSKSMQQIFKEAASAVITQEQSLDILLAGCGLLRSDGLPSWVPDWRREASDKRATPFTSRKRFMTRYKGSSWKEDIVIVGHEYKAFGDSKVVFSFSGDLGILHVSCKIIDTIAMVDKVHVNETSEVVLGSATKLVESSREFVGNAKGVGILGVLIAGKDGSFVENYTDEVIQNVMNGRRFIITKSGHLGVGPGSIQKGHIVCVIAGCNFPIVLCAEGDHYLLVGEAFVRNMTSGEALGNDFWPWQEIKIH